MKKLFKIYELSRGGIIWDTISINSIDLDNGKENSSSIIVMFSNKSFVIKYYYVRIKT